MYDTAPMIVSAAASNNVQSAAFAIRQARRPTASGAACGAGIPAWLEQLFEGVDGNSPLHAMLAANVAVEQCRRLAAEGLTRLHVYALNRTELPLALLRLLGVAAPVPAAAA